MTTPRACLDAIGAAATTLADAEAGLGRAVAQARAEGHTWQEIADVLGVTRQAAFKRFGQATDPATGRPVVPAPTGDVAALCREVVDRLAAGEADAVRRKMTQSCARTLTRAVLESVWVEVLASVGELERVETATAHTLDGTPASEPETPLPAVGRAELVHEAGELYVHVVVNRDGRITGIVLRPADTPETWPL